MDAGDGDSNAIPFSRPLPRYTSTETNIAIWHHERGHFKREHRQKYQFRDDAADDAGDLERKKDDEDE